jgi:hypothetical protein
VVSRLLLVVHLSSERVRQAVRQDCSFAKKQQPQRECLLVVQEGRLRLPTIRFRFRSDFRRWAAGGVVSRA